MNINELPDYARDAFYVTVGLGVLATQRLEAQRQTLIGELEARLSPVREQIRANLPTIIAPQITIPALKRHEGLGRLDLSNLDLGSLDLESITGAIEKISDRFDERSQQLDARFAELEARVDGVLDRIEDQLPEAAREVVSQARGVAKEARGQLRTMVSRAA